MKVTKIPRRTLNLHEVIADGVIYGTAFEVQIPTPSNSIIVRLGRDRYSISLKELVVAVYESVLNAEGDMNDIEQTAYKYLGLE